MSSLFVEYDVELEGARRKKGEGQSTHRLARGVAQEKGLDAHLLVWNVPRDEPSFHEVIRVKFGESLLEELRLEVCEGTGRTASACLALTRVA